MLHRHRDYASLLKQHERDKRKKWTKRFILYSFLMAIILTLLLLIFSYWMVKLEHERENKKEQKTGWMINANRHRPVT